MGRARPLIALAVLIAAVAVMAHVQHARHVRAKVVDAARRGSTTHARPAMLPDFSARGWRAVGGRTDVIGGRTVLSAEYRRGRTLVTYSRMADTKGLNDGPAGGIVRRWGRLELTWQQLPILSARTVVGGHQVVLTGTPASEGLRRELTRLAALAA
ncbi:MAG: hypothetical protein JWQ18_2153 [Conexibacter sp.]|nr:hypothetical protein [Conexibacter sp.]